MGNYSPEYKKEICKRIIDGGEKVTHVCRTESCVEQCPKMNDGCILPES